MDIDLEWDEHKRQQTLHDRCVDFADFAFIYWDTALTEQDIRKSNPEIRYITLGYIHERLHVCVWCYHNDKIRVTR